MKRKTNLVLFWWSRQEDLKKRSGTAIFFVCFVITPLQKIRHLLASAVWNKKGLEIVWTEKSQQLVPRIIWPRLTMIINDPSLPGRLSVKILQKVCKRRNLSKGKIPMSINSYSSLQSVESIFGRDFEKVNCYQLLWTQLNTSVFATMTRLIYRSIRASRNPQDLYKREQSLVLEKYWFACL